MVEHCVDIAGVASSILATPTIKSPGNSTSYRGFFLAETPTKPAPMPNICRAKSGISAAHWADSGHVADTESWPKTRRLAKSGNEHTTGSGAPLVHVRGGRLDDHEETSRARVSGHRRVLGRGPVRADERGSPMSIKDPAPGAASPADAAVPLGPIEAKAPMAGCAPMAPITTGVASPPGTIVSLAVRDGADGARSPPGKASVGTADTLLTPQDILDLLGITSAEPAKWMRRTFTKHGVPYMHVCGQVRATQAQYRLLLDKITCSPSVPVGRTAFSTSVAKSRSATSGLTSKNSVQERVTQMLRRT